MSSCWIFLKIINFEVKMKLITVWTRFKRRSRRCISICQEESLCQNHYYTWRSKFRTSRRLRSKNMRKFCKTLSKRLLRWNNFSPKYSKFYNPGVFFLFSRIESYFCWFFFLEKNYFIFIRVATRQALEMEERVFGEINLKMNSKKVTWCIIREEFYLWLTQGQILTEASFL